MLRRLVIAHLGAKVRLLAPEFDTLLNDVVEIELGRRAGSWTFDRGRLWVVAGA
jgi:hypothetical protein